MNSQSEHGTTRCPHCDTPIDEHPANRCLDAWVAEAVMGLTYVFFDVELLERASQGRMAAYYSTDIAAAWQIIEKLRKQDMYYKLGFNGDGLPYYIEAGFYEETLARADTAPLAICIAAIKALS